MIELVNSPIEKEFEQVLNTFPEEKMKEVENNKLAWCRVWALINSLVCLLTTYK